MTHRFDKRMEFLQKNIAEIYLKIINIEKFSTYWETYEKLSPDFLGNLKKSVIVSSTGSSTRIEGSKLSDEQIEAMIYTSSMKNLATRDEQEVAGYMELIKYVFSAYQRIPLSEGTILQFHEISMQYSEKDQLHKGKYKTSSNKVILVENGIEKGVIFEPTEPHLVRGEMIALIEWTRTAFAAKNHHPLLIIANFIFEYLSIHPFKDGNGRTSRILTNLLLLQQGYSFVPYVSHEKVIEENKVDYYLALRHSTKHWKTKTDENILDWVLFFLKIVDIQGQQAKEITTKEDPSDFLSRNQNLVWQCFLKKPEWSRKELFEETHISIKSIEKVIKKLRDMKQIRMIGAGRGTRYRIVK